MQWLYYHCKIIWLIFFIFLNIPKKKKKNWHLLLPEIHNPVKKDNTREIIFQGMVYLKFVNIYFIVGHTLQ